MNKLVVYIKNLNSISIFLLFYIFQLFLSCFQCTPNLKKNMPFVPVILLEIKFYTMKLQKLM